jgi:hypothetical protein
MRESHEVIDHQKNGERVKEDARFKDLLDRLRKQSPEQIQRLQEFLDNLPSLAPYPPKQGHKFAAERGRISVTLDSNLLKLLEEKRQSVGLSMSRMVETAVWIYFNQPPLSFQ